LSAATTLARLTLTATAAEHGKKEEGLGARLLRHGRRHDVLHHGFGKCCHAGPDGPKLTAARRPDSCLRRRRQQTTSGGLRLGRRPRRAGDVRAALARKNRARGRPWQRAGGVGADLRDRVPRRWSSSVVELSSWATGNRLPVARSHHVGKGEPRRGGGGVGWQCTSRSCSG
jgi:hypothetical protein